MHGLKAKFACVLYTACQALFEGKVCLCYIGDGSCSDCNSCNGLKDGRLYLRKSFQTPSTSTNHIFFEPKHQPFNSDLWEVFRYFILNYPTNEVSPLETSERSSDLATGSNNKQMPCKTNRLGTGAAGCLQRTYTWLPCVWMNRICRTEQPPAPLRFPFPFSDRIGPMDPQSGDNEPLGW